MSDTLLEGEKEQQQILLVKYNEEAFDQLTEEEQYAEIEKARKINRKNAMLLQFQLARLYCVEFEENEEKRKHSLSEMILLEEKIQEQKIRHDLMEERKSRSAKKHSDRSRSRSRSSSSSSRSRSSSSSSRSRSSSSSSRSRSKSNKRKRSPSPKTTTTSNNNTNNKSNKSSNNVDNGRKSQEEMPPIMIDMKNKDRNYAASRVNENFPRRISNQNSRYNTSPSNNNSNDNGGYNYPMENNNYDNYNNYTQPPIQQPGRIVRFNGNMDRYSDDNQYKKQKTSHRNQSSGESRYNWNH